MGGVVNQKTSSQLFQGGRMLRISSWQGPHLVMTGKPRGVSRVAFSATCSEEGPKSVKILHLLLFNVWCVSELGELNRQGNPRASKLLQSQVFKLYPLEEGMGTYSCLENPHGQRSMVGYSL